MRTGVRGFHLTFREVSSPCLTKWLARLTTSNPQWLSSPMRLTPRFNVLFLQQHQSCLCPNFSQPGLVVVGPHATLLESSLRQMYLPTRVDVVIFKAVDQRGSTTQPDSEWCKGAFSRLLEVCKGFFRVPLAVRCDRLFFERSDDAVYIDQMARYLSDDSVTTPPVLSDPELYRVFVTEDRTKASQHRLMWAVLVMRKKILTHEDFFHRSSFCDGCKQSHGSGERG